MRVNERAIIGSCGGAIVAVLLVMGAFALFGSRPLWAATAARNEVFDAGCAYAMALSIPLGAAVGALVGGKWRGFWPLLLNSLMGCVAGAVAFFQAVTFSGVTNPLYICGAGLVIVPLICWLVAAKGGPKQLPPRR